MTHPLRLAMVGLLLAISIGRAGHHQSGSFFFSDVQALLAQQPPLNEFIMSHLQTANGGNALRINAYDSEELQGARIGPYNIPCKPKAAPGAYTLMLVIEAEAAFLDANRREVPLKRAVEIRERLTGIRLRTLTTSEIAYYQQIETEKHSLGK